MTIAIERLIFHRGPFGQVDCRLGVSMGAEQREKKRTRLENWILVFCGQFGSWWWHHSYKGVSTCNSFKTRPAHGKFNSHPFQTPIPRQIETRDNQLHFTAHCLTPGPPKQVESCLRYLSKRMDLFQTIRSHPPAYRLKW